MGRPDMHRVRQLLLYMPFQEAIGPLDKGGEGEGEGKGEGVTLQTQSLAKYCVKVVCPNAHIPKKYAPLCPASFSLSLAQILRL